MKDHDSQGANAGKQHPWIHSRTWIFLSLSFLTIYALLVVTGNIIYYINDDTTMITLTKSGIFRIIAVHSLLSWLLVVLYSFKQNIFWYDLLVAGFYCAGISYLFYLFNTFQKLTYPVTILLLSCILLGFIPFQPNYTFLAMLSSLVAIVPFLFQGKDQYAGFPMRIVIASFIFLILACLYRRWAVIIFVFCGIAINTLLKIYAVLKGEPDSKGKGFIKRTSMLCAMALFACIMFIIDNQIVQNPQEYKRFIRYDNYRIGVQDFNYYLWDKSWQRKGISLGDYIIMVNFMGIDSPPLNLENLEKLKPLSIWDKRRLKLCLESFFNFSKLPFSLLLYGILFCGCLICREARINSLACVGLIAAITLYTSKMTPPIGLPFLAMGAIVSIPFIESELNNAGPKKKKCFYLTFSLIFLFTLYFSISFQFSKLDERTNTLKQTAPLWEFIEKNKIDSVVYWTTAIPGGNRLMFKNGINYPTNTRIDKIGGWAGSYPHNLKDLRKVYGQDIYKGLAQPGTYHLWPRFQAKLFLVFIKEHAPPDTTARILFKTDRTILVKLVKKHQPGS